MRAKTSACLVVCVLWALSAGLVFAGEVNGRGEEIPGGETGRSLCSYSGLQDDPIADEGFFRGDRVQSWGQIPKAMRDFLTSIGAIPHPSEGCNPLSGEPESASRHDDSPTPTGAPQRAGNPVSLPGR